MLALDGRKIRLNVTPEHAQFAEHYHSARRGFELPPEGMKAAPTKGSIGWLIDLFSAFMETSGLDPGTIKQRRVFLEWLRSEAGQYNAEMPVTQLVRLRDKKAATPGAADNFVKTVRAMYRWGTDRGHVKLNPAKGIGKINEGEGARPWMIEDLKQFRQHHPSGSMAFLALTLYMFTACRISDVVLLGPEHETQRDGAAWIDWTPRKKGSRRIQIPIMPPLARAIAATKLKGQTYLLTEHGRPFASSAAFGNRFRHWVDQAGLPGLSSHGIRKAVGELLALEGASQYHIMAIHGHASARTSEVYTQGAERARLAAQAMTKFDFLDW